jgi:hypothetical protein
MSEIFYDRLTGHTVSKPETSQTILGRWLIVPMAGNGVFLNSVPVSSGDFLVPEISGNWRLLHSDGTVVQGSCSRRQQPEDMEAESIRTIGAHLDSLAENGATWLDWLEVVPLVPGMSEKVNILRFEKTIQQLFGHLRTVCMKPHAHLNVEVERVPIVRARRLPIRAASYLASHTEDWERPLMRGVLPKRILSEVRHDEIDIYENRVSARLIDHITVYLNKRILEIRKLLKMFQDKEDYSSTVGGTHLRQKRILELWGESIDTNEGRNKAEDTFKKLKRLKQKIMGLMDSPLYGEVPRFSHVSPTLRNTNILINDQHYRRVAELWREWISTGYSDTKSPFDIYHEAQKLCGSMDRFALLLVARALDQLGYEIAEKHWEEPVCASGRWMLEGHGTSLECAWQEDGKVRVEMEGEHLVFLSVPVDFRAAANDAQLEMVIDHIVEVAANSDGRAIVLYAGSSDNSRKAVSKAVAQKLLTVGNDPRVKLPENVGFLPISPWDIGSVERISRALRWFLDSTRFDSYPLEIELEPEASEVIKNTRINDWLDISDGCAKVTIKRPLKAFEWSELEIENLVEETRLAHCQAISEHKRISDELRTAALSKGRTGTLNPQKKSAYQVCFQLENRLKAIERLKEQLAGAQDRSDALLVCPACGTKADPSRDFKPRQKGCFRCDCQGCHTRWATRLCTKGHRYAVMLPGKFVETEDGECGWEERIYGSDLLSLPARKANGEWGFLCPFCGEIN